MNVLFLLAILLVCSDLSDSGLYWAFGNM